jgi:hypothetical protein
MEKKLCLHCNGAGIVTFPLYGSLSGKDTMTSLTQTLKNQFKTCDVCEGAGYILFFEKYIESKTD